MDGKTFPITITAQMRHGVLWEARQKLGTAKALSEALGISHSQTAALINFRWAPGPAWLNRHGERVELKLSEVLERPVTLAEIFPPEICSERFKSLAKRVEYTVEVEPERLIGAGAATALSPAPEAVEIREAIDRALSDLKPRDVQIVTMKYGLDGGGERTYEEIAVELGVTRERIRQIEARALRRLRHPSKSRLLKPLHTAM